jgi:TonB family protein
MRFRIALGWTVWVICQTASPLHANQDTLSAARELYLSADYDGALAVLDRLAGDPHGSRTALAEFRVFCLLALERSDEARQAIKGIVEADPFYLPSEAEASPRNRAVFRDTRKAVLPGIAQRAYAEAKASFERHDPSAAIEFDRLIALLDDPDLQDPQLSDLRTVAAGFRDLSKAAAAAPAPPLPQTTVSIPLPPIKVESLPAGPLTGSPTRIRVSTRGALPLLGPQGPPPSGLEPPVALSQQMPRWSPKGAAALAELNGAIELLIDEQGSVADVTLRQSIYPAFDKQLLSAARKWKYRPAMLNGTPVSFLKVIEIQIQPEL